MSAEYGDLTKFGEALSRFGEQEREVFIRSCAKEIAARLLAKVVKRTPVGVYNDRVGGTLRRGWTAAKSVYNFTESLKVRREGGKYIIDIINPVEYASYVEYGHRTPNHEGWVKGRFMLTVSVKEIRSIAPALLEKRVRDKLKEVIK